MNEIIKNLPQRVPHRLRRPLFAIALLTGFAVALSIFLFRQPMVVSPVGASLGVMEVSNTKPLAIVFNHPVNKKKLAYEIHPELKGNWELSSSIFSSRATLKFTPTESPDLDTRYTIALSGISGISGAQEENYLLSFQTDSLPILQSVSPATTAIDISPDAPIVLTFDKAISDAVVITATLTPALILDEPRVSENVITFPHIEQFQKGTVYTVTAFLSTVKTDYDTNTKAISEEKKEIATASFTTIAAPGIQTYGPTGTSTPITSTIFVEFQQMMDPESTQSAFSIAPAVAGAFTWENEKKMIFTPATTLAKDQTYTVTIANIAKAASGFTLEAPFSFPFTTIGSVVVSGFTPSGGTSGVDTGTAVHVAFNQEVVQASAQNSFSLSPSVDGSFSWNGNTMVFRPAVALASGKSYTVTVAKGVQSVNGLDSSSNFSAKFTTKSKSVMLSVPAFAQAHNYSCMIAAARAALAYRGVSVSEADIISRVGKDTTPWSGTWGKDGSVWGDPDAAIVGDLDGRTNDIGWGYGSHWAPIAKALTSYGILNEVQTGMTVQDLAQAITDGNPVMVWWVNGVWPAYEVKWKTKTGKQIRGVNSMHVQVVRGFTGTVDDPVSFTVTDSGYGYPGRTLDVGTFKAKWGWFGNTGIIVK